MATGPDQQRLSPADRSNLVAYLDGELSETDTHSIATKLTRSATARREIELLQRTWEMLDLLPRPKASEKLTARTLTGVQQLSLAGDRFESALKQKSRQVGKAVLWVLASGAALAIGYAATRWVWPDPTSRLARDLTIAEHLDEYQDVATFDYLDALARSPQFGTDPD